MKHLEGCRRGITYLEEIVINESLQVEIAMKTKDASLLGKFLLDGLKGRKQEKKQANAKQHCKFVGVEGGTV